MHDLISSEDSARIPEPRERRLPLNPNQMNVDEMSEVPNALDEKREPTILQQVLKSVFGKVRNVDETSSLADYLFKNPTK